MFLLFWVMYIAIVIIVIKKMSYENSINPMFYLCLTWSFMLGTYLTSGIDFFYKPTLSSVLYLCFSFLTMVFGYVMGKRVFFSIGKKRKYRFAECTYDEASPALEMYFWVGAVGGVLRNLDIVFQNDIVFGTRSVKNSSFFSTIGGILMGMLLPVVAYEIYRSVERNVRISIKFYIAVVLFSLNYILSGGRIGLFLLTFEIISIVLCALKKFDYKYKKQVVLMIIIMLVISLFFMTVIVDLRQGNIDQAALISYGFKSSFDNRTLDILKKYPKYRNIFIQGAFYFSHEIPNFSYFYDHYSEYFDFKYLGLYSMPVISNHLPSSWTASITNIEAIIAKMSASAGVGAHTWRTVISNTIIDFGKKGSLVVIFLVFHLIGRIHSSWRKSPSVYGAIVLSFLCSGTAFSIMYSATKEILWFYGLFWMLLVPYIKGKIVLFRKKNL